MTGSFLSGCGQIETKVNVTTVAYAPTKVGFQKSRDSPESAGKSLIENSMSALQDKYCGVWYVKTVVIKRNFTKHTYLPGLCEFEFFVFASKKFYV
jgi:hypothetical protein